MQTKVSTTGRVVLPGSLRRKLGIRAGDPLDAEIEEGRIVLTPQKKRVYKTSIITDPLTGLPVLNAEEGAPVLTSGEVEEILADFP